MNARRTPNHALRYVLGGLLALVAVNAFGGGIYGLAGAEGVPKDWLAGTPFVDYFVPSLILFVVVGGAFLVAAIAVFLGARRARWLAAAAGIVALGWIAVQVAILGYVSWLQPAVAIAATTVLILASCLPGPTRP